MDASDALALEELSTELQMLIARELIATRDMRGLARLARRPDVSPLLDALLSEFPDAPLRAAWLASPRRTVAELERHVSDRRVQVRAAIAGHANAPADALEALSHDSSKLVLRALADNSAAPSIPRARAWSAVVAGDPWYSSEHFDTPGSSFSQAQHCLAAATTLNSITAAAENCFPTSADWDRISATMTASLRDLAEQQESAPRGWGGNAPVAIQVAHAAQLLLAGYPDTRLHVEDALAVIDKYLPRQGAPSSWWAPIRQLVPLLGSATAEVSTLTLAQRLRESRHGEARDLAVAFCNRPVHTAASVRVLAWHPDVPVHTLRIVSRSLTWRSLLAVTHMDFSGARTSMLAVIATGASLDKPHQWLGRSPSPTSLAKAMVREAGARVLDDLEAAAALEEDVLLASPVPQLLLAGWAVRARAVHLADASLSRFPNALEVFWSLQPTYLGSLDDLLATARALSST